MKKRNEIGKVDYWKYFLDDGLDVVAKVSRIAAMVFDNCYGEGKGVAARDSKLDYSANFANMLGSATEDFTELMRLYLVIHAYYL